MRRMKAFVVVLAVVGATFATATSAAADPKDKLVDRIVAKADPNLMEVLVTTRDKGGRPKFDTVKVPDVAAAKRVVHDKLGRSGVVGVEMNRRVSVASNDTLFRYQWALDNRHFYFDRVSYVTRNDTYRPYIAVVDSGVQASHPDLVGNIRSGYNATNRAMADDCGHGTHVAGIIAATSNNGQGVAGLEQRAHIVPVKALRWYPATLLGDPAGCYGDSRTVSEGITWAADHAHIISLSIESEAPSNAESNAIAYARSRGRAVVAAAGNAGDGRVVYPAGYSGVIGVGAVQKTSSSPYWTPASFSNPGYWVDVAAPGVHVLSTVPPGVDDACGSGAYCYMSGTSMATPYASATIALGVQHCRWSVATATSMLVRTASHYPKRYASVGYGVVNPLKLLQC